MVLNMQRLLKVSGEILQIQNRCTEREIKYLRKIESMRTELKTLPFTSSFLILSILTMGMDLS